MPVVTTQGESAAVVETLYMVLRLRDQPPAHLSALVREYLSHQAAAVGPELILPPNTSFQDMLDRAIPSTVPPAPNDFRLLSLDPSGSFSGGPVFLRCLGSGLPFGTEIWWGNQALPTEYVADTEVTGAVDLSPGASGYIGVYLKHPNGSHSQTLYFVVTAPAALAVERGA